MAPLPLRPNLTVVVLLCLLLYSTIAFGSKTDEEFSEELLLKPLPDRKVLAHFHFQSTTSPSTSFGRHHHLFPKAISQLVKKFRVKEMELSFTQGRWRYEQWGGFDPISSNNAKPPGVELWAVFDVPQSDVDATWKNLTHALSGLFCASINFLESPTTYSAPTWAFRPHLENLRYGSLPREAVCTENLTPWLKLLPCRDKAGLSVLMDRPSIYRGYYHSQRLHLTRTEASMEDVDSSIILQQTLTVVLEPSDWRTKKSNLDKANLQPNWSISSIFGREVTGKCVLAKSSNVYLHLEKGLVDMLRSRSLMSEELASDSFSSNLSFYLSVKPDKVFEEVHNLPSRSTSVLYQFSVDKYNDSQPLNLGFSWKVPLQWSCPQAPLHASRFLMGSGNERGAIAIYLKSTELGEGLKRPDSSGQSCEFRVNVFQVVPWYIKVYYHTLQVFVDRQSRAVADIIEKINVSPSKDKVSPGVMEMILKLPCGLESAALNLEFDKGFLHIDEYPPDANQGYDIPAALVSYPDYHTNLNFSEYGSVEKSPMLSQLEEKSLVLSYTEILLVPLTTPDFSMPYNVITITCTVFALYFGSLLNVLRRRVGEEERFLKSNAGKKTGLARLLSQLYNKLRRKPSDQEPSNKSSSSFVNSNLVFKIIFVAGIAVCWQYYYG